MSSTRLFNPFPGLRPFNTGEDYLFFGREQQTAELLKLLRRHRFLAVVGTSGSGKSSLVRAGLLPELQGGTLNEAGSAWEIALLRPGGNPIRNLARSLCEAALYDPEESNVEGHLVATLTHSGLGLVEAVRQSDIEPGANLLVVVDQFEELFRFRQTSSANEDVAAGFVNLLLEASRQKDVPVYVILTMRSDYIGDCAEFRGLAEAVNDGEYLIPRLSRDQLRSAIEGPVKVGGGVIANRLVQELLGDVGTNQDQLPLLQHALMRTWDYWESDRAEGEPLDLRHYESVGGMQAALSRHADEIFDELPDDRHRLVAEKLFKALTERGPDNRGIRRPTRLDRLCAIVDATPEELGAVVDAFRKQGRTFLMPMEEVELTPQTVIDISHESLMRVWQRLHHWVEQESQSVRIYRRLAETAALHQQGKAGVYHDPDLQIAIAWKETTQPTEAWAQRYHEGYAKAMAFLELSERKQREQEQAREAARRHELEQAKQLAETQRLRAEEQRRAAVRLRWLVGGLAGVAAVALVAFMVAANAKNEAQRNERTAIEAQSRALEAAQAAGVARDEAESARQQERIQREVAETQTAAAIEAQRQLKTALAQAETARQSAEEAKVQAEQSQQQAEADRQRAEAAERRAVEDRKRAEREKLLAEQSAQLASRRERLFERLLPLLQEHASEGVREFARSLQEQGKPREALNTYGVFADLVLGEHHAGLLASELLDLDSFELQGLDSEAIDVEISVPAQSLLTDVLIPAIDLGEQELAKESSEQLQHLVATLHAYRARLLEQHPNEPWASGESAAQMIFDSFDRAATLEPQRDAHFLGRAGARFRLPERDLSLVLEDLNAALRLHPDPPSPVADNDPVTEHHRQFAQLHHAKGNVLEYLAVSDEAGEPARLFSDAQQSHRQAQAFDPHDPRYLVAVARTLRKHIRSAGSDAPQDEDWDRAERLLREAVAMAADSPEPYNELGELYMAQGRIADSRKAFETAVQYAKLAGRDRGLYVAYCNLANALTRDPTDQAGYQRALAAAEQAVALQADAPVEGHYYRGFALWKLGRTADALDAFSEAIQIEPEHLDAVLAKCQIIFEMTDPNPPTSAQLKQAYADARDVLAYPHLTTDERAKANYVNGLAWLRYHLQQKSEDALVRCQDFALKAAQGSPAYLPFAKQIFEYAAGVTWSDVNLRQDSERLQQQLEALTEGDAAGTD